MTRTHLAAATMIAAGLIITGTGPVSAGTGLLYPWNFDWRHTAAWQQGVSRPTPYFAPPGCFIERWVATPHSVAWKRLYLCR